MAPSDVSSLTPLPNPRRVVTANNETTGTGEVLFDDSPQTQIGFKGVLREVGLWTTSQSPADNSSRVDTANKSLDALVMPGGSNCRVTDLGPVSGRAVHILEDGSEQELGPGDTVVQRGTHHRWENRTNDWVRWITVLVEAKPVIVNGKELGALME